MQLNVLDLGEIDVRCENMTMGNIYWNMVNLSLVTLFSPINMGHSCESLFRIKDD